MQDFEKLGVFYLGRHYDPATKKTTDDLVLYDSKDLVTHALCVGMTGSGKTGLGIAVIEEAAIDGVPVIVIDPKGDLTNLLLTFPDLRPDDFAPWVNEDDARRAGKTTAEFAAEQAERWKKGLAEWGEDGARIQRLRDAAEFALYTPGSTAGVPVSVLTSFARPTIDDPELLRERVQTTVSSLLALAGIDAEPLKSREHILLSTILLAAWQAGESPDLATLIQRVQQPPMTRIGVMDVESFFPSKDRFAFAMSINALIASPGFEVWSQGEPLDVAAFLRSQSGKPRVSIFSIAHLDDSQRMFFVALLLNAVAGWMRGQTRHVEPARDGLHGRDLRLLPAGREPAVEGAAAHAAEAGPRRRRRRRAGDAEPGRSRLQGAVEHRHVVAGPPADRSRQGARARRTRERERFTAASIARRSIGCCRR